MSSIKALLFSGLAMGVLLMMGANLSAADGQLKIALVGDSTVTDNAGWGRGFEMCVRPERAQVLNFARGGRSSKSFYDEGLWQKVLDARPDIIFIQFGHNDQPGKGPDRRTDPETTYRENLVRYIEQARAINATPILVTPLSRREWDKDRRHIKSSLVPYAQAIRIVGKKMDVPVIDLHDRSIEMYESLGPEGVQLMSPTKPGGFDGTHLNAVGSEVIGALMDWEFRRTMPQYAGVMTWIRPENRASTTQPMAVKNSDEVEAALKARAAAPTPQGERTLTVAQDGTGEFLTVQEAIAAIPDNNADRTTILIRQGVYTGPFVLTRPKQNVTFKGEGADKTILTYAPNVADPLPSGVPGNMKGTGMIALGDGFHADGITFQNTSGDHGQAMAIRLESDRSIITNCRLLGWQDTLRVHSKRQYFRDCYIEGRVDFIYGGATSVFDRCEIHSKNGGYVTAASTPQEQPYGYVFFNCRLTGDGEATTWLGRPWRPYASVTFINCHLGAHIKPEGWNNWGKESNEQTARYAEYHSTGPGAAPEQRVKWSHQLTDEQAAQITIQSVLRGEDGWDPTR